MKITKTFLIKKYWKEKLTTFEIAKLCKVAQATIMRRMEKLDIPRRKYGQHLKIKNYPTKEVLFKKYFIERKTQQEIADELNCGRVTVRNYLMKYNIKFRKTKINNKKSPKKIPIKKHGKKKKRPKDKQYFCKDCRKEIHWCSGFYGLGRCNKCQGLIHRNKERFEKHHCKEINCNNEICYQTWKNGEGRCLSCANRGELSNNYIHGKSNEPYPLGWNKTFKEQIRYRDGYKCRLCGCPEVECNRRLHVHHIDYDKTNINPKNLISLCQRCHMRTNYNRDCWTLFFETKKVENVAI